MIVITSGIDMRGFIGSALQLMTTRSIYVAERINEVFLQRLEVILSMPGTGRTYPSKRKDGSRHVASAPGQAPAPDTQRYKRSWFGRVVVDGMYVKAYSGTPLWEVFGRRLEFGGTDKRGIYIAPRPHVSVAFQQTEAPINRLLDGIGL